MHWRPCKEYSLLAYRTKCATCNNPSDASVYPAMGSTLVTYDARRVVGRNKSGLAIRAAYNVFINTDRTALCKTL